MNHVKHGIPPSRTTCILAELDALGRGAKDEKEIKRFNAAAPKPPHAAPHLWMHHRARVSREADGHVWGIFPWRRLRAGGGGAT